MSLKELTALRTYAAATTVGLCTLFAQDRSPSFEEITVERINVVGADGSLAVVISNRERFPDPVIDGVVAPRSSSHPGLLFYNDEGDECGGLVFSGGDERASTSLLFDRRKQDQTVGLNYSEWVEDGRAMRQAGLRVWDRPDLSLNDVMDARRRISAIEDDAERQAEIDAFLDELGYPDPFGCQRLFVGRSTTGDAGVFLRDGRGRPRLRLAVSHDGAARLEFLDEAGAVERALTPDD
jgi:hypothetical protein